MRKYLFQIVGIIIPMQMFMFSTPVIAGITSIPGITGVTFYEMTDSTRRYDYSLTPSVSPELLQQFPDGPSRDNYDFIGSGTAEAYDVFLSDADGSVNADGNFLTIVCNYTISSTNGATGNNIDAVALNFSSYPPVYADIVESVQLGGGLSGEYLTNNGYVINALGSPDFSCTTMGSGISRMTLGFSTVPEPSTLALLVAGVLGVVLFSWKRRRG